MWCAGIRKTYWITCNNDTEMQNVMVERNSFPSHLVIKPKDLGRLLGHFQSSLQEITLIATEPVSNDMDPDSEAKAIELKSYIDPARGGVASLTFQCWSLLEVYDVSFHLRAFVRSSFGDYFRHILNCFFE